MSKKTHTLKEVRHSLNHVDEEWKAFWFNHGVIAHDLSELADALKKISKENFAYHVNKSKNDISEWIEHALGDKNFAKRMKRIKNLKTAQKAVADRVSELSKVIEKATASAKTRPKALRVLRRKAA